MSDLVFFTNPQSRGRIVHWMLEEVGEPYTTRWLDYGPTGTKSAQYLAVNPMGKLPAISHGDQVVTETPAICAYLAARFPASGLQPQAGDAGLAAYFRWLFFAAGPLEQSITAAAMGWEVAAERKGTVGFGSHEEVLAAIAAMLQQSAYVCGDQFTAADVYLGSHLSWGMAFDTIPKEQVYVDYVARATDRPAYHRANSINEEKLAAGNQTP